MSSLSFATGTVHQGLVTQAQQAALTQPPHLPHDMHAHGHGPHGPAGSRDKSGISDAPPLSETLPALCTEFIEQCLLPPTPEKGAAGSEDGTGDGGDDALTGVEAALADDEGSEDEPADLEGMIKGQEGATVALLEMLLRLAGQQQRTSLRPLMMAVGQALSHMHGQVSNAGMSTRTGMDSVQSVRPSRVQMRKAPGQSGSGAGAANQPGAATGAAAPSAPNAPANGGGANAKQAAKKGAAALPAVPEDGAAPSAAAKQSPGDAGALPHGSRRGSSFTGEGPGPHHYHHHHHPYGYHAGWPPRMPAVALPSIPKAHVPQLAKVIELLLRLVGRAPSPAMLLKPLTGCLSTIRKLALITHQQLLDLTAAQQRLPPPPPPQQPHSGNDNEGHPHHPHHSGNQHNIPSLPQQVATAVSAIAAVGAQLATLPGMLIEALQARLVELLQAGNVAEMGMLQGIASQTLMQLAPGAWHICSTLFAAEAASVQRSRVMGARLTSMAGAPPPNQSPPPAATAPASSVHAAPSEALHSAVAGFWKVMPTLAATLNTSPDWAGVFFAPNPGMTIQQYNAMLAGSVEAIKEHVTHLQEAKEKEAALKQLQQQLVMQPPAGTAPPAEEGDDAVVAAHPQELLLREVSMGMGKTPRLAAKAASRSQSISQPNGPGFEEGDLSGQDQQQDGKGAAAAAEDQNAPGGWLNAVELIQSVQAMGQAWSELQETIEATKRSALTREEIMSVLNSANMGMSAESQGYALINKLGMDPSTVGQPPPMPMPGYRAPPSPQDSVMAARNRPPDEGLALLQKLQGPKMLFKSRNLPAPAPASAVELGVCANPECTNLSGPCDGLTPLVLSCPRCAKAMYCSPGCMEAHKPEHRLTCKPAAKY